MTKQVEPFGVSGPLQINRRSFIVGAGSGIAGVGLLSLRVPRSAFAEPRAVLFGWGSFLRGLLRFAKKVGMTALTLTLTHYLEGLAPGVGREVGGSIEGLSNRGYSVEEESGGGRVIVGDSSMCTCLVNPANVREGQLDRAALVPFYDTSPRAASRVSSVLSTPTMAAMPFIAEDLEQLDFGTEERFGLLVPTLARQNSYNMTDLTDTYLTRAGGVEAEFRPYGDNSGDLKVRVTRKRPGKSERLEPVLDKYYGIEFAA